MRIPLLLLLIASNLAGCSLFEPKTTYLPLDPNNPVIVTETVDQRTGSITVTTTQAETFVVDDSKPASFDDYKKWRRENDPGGQTYADFKEWEAALGEWKLQQQQAIK
jgi:hypothetical protein